MYDWIAKLLTRAGGADRANSCLLVMSKPMAAWIGEVMRVLCYFFSAPISTTASVTGSSLLLRQAWRVPF